jgi:hypothetical protein
VATQFDLVLPQDCPPAGAAEKEQNAFRIVKSRTPTESDLKTHQELDLVPHAPPCKRASVSVFSTYEHAKHRLDMSPHLGKYIAQALLSQKHGQFSGPNPVSGHIDWWPYCGMRNPTDFTVIEP